MPTPAAPNDSGKPFITYYIGTFSRDFTGPPACIGRIPPHWRNVTTIYGYSLPLDTSDAGASDAPFGDV